MKLRALTIGVATAALLAAGAVAQDRPNPGGTEPGTPPAATPGAPSTPGAAPSSPQTPANPDAAANKPDTKATPDKAAQDTSGGSIQFSSSVNSGDMLASDLIGMQVKNASGDNLGSVTDLVLDPSGKSSVAVIGVGGFLGIGQKDVGVPFNRLQIAMDQSNKRVARLDIDKTALKSAPNFVYQDKQASAMPPVKSSY